MSVIGRLDEQVDAVLISPVSRQRGREETNTPDARDEFPKSEDPRAEETEHQNTREQERLPVWLL